MIKSIIIDDEPNSVEALNEMLTRYCPPVSVEATANNINTAKELIIKHQARPDIHRYRNALWECIRPAQQYSQDQLEVVFVTAFDNYALNAIKLSALDYLLKPVSIKELQAAVAKAEEKIKGKNISSRIENLLYNLKSPPNSSKRLALPTFEGLTFLDSDDFVRLEASNNYTFIFLKDKTKIVSVEAFERI